MAQVNIRMDDDLKERAETFFEELGFTFSSAFNVFVRQSLRDNRIPFDIAINNQRYYTDPETLQAFQEARQLVKDPTAKRFRSVEALFEDLESDDDD